MVSNLIRVFEVLEPAHCTSLRLGKFGPNAAAGVWDTIVQKVRWRFQRHLWYDILSKDPNSSYIPDIEERLHSNPSKGRVRVESDDEKDKIVCKLLRLALTGMRVEGNARIIPESDLTFKGAALLYDLVPEGIKYRVHFPLVAAYVINAEFDAVPGNLLKTNPFIADPTHFEQVSTIALAAQFAVRNPGEELSIHEVRRDAQIYVAGGCSDLQSLKLTVPDAPISLNKLANHLRDRAGNELPLCIEAGVPFHEEIVPGMFFLAAVDQKAMDSFAFLEGLLQSATQRIPVVILSQYKMLRPHEPSTGAPSHNTLHDSGVIPIVKELQLIEKDVANKIGLKRRRIVVFDLFTTRLEGERQGLQGYDTLLQPDQILLVTTVNNASEALGPMLGIREGAKRLAVMASSN